ncbi:MAG TPA: DHHA1 domain-containing protein [Bacillota bacterium]|nr:DHHA1 domain-containing protein [Bacillota bacterium]HOK68377.1 DHHA1 domain-containing protein [Bacillota bacterium]HPP85527.1 DHHA1 domain-containing protein [Bacillota bacterium]
MNALDITINQAARFFLENDNFLIVSHTSPDADTVGSASALVAGLRKLGKNAAAVCDEPIPDRLLFLDANGCFIQNGASETCSSGGPNAILPSIPAPFQVQTYVSVDVASATMLGRFEQRFLEKFFDLSIDHHLVNTIPCKRRLLCTGYSSSGEIIYELLTLLGVEIDRSIAVSLYGAISSDSGGFRYSATRSQTMRYAADLIETGIDFAKINRLLFETKSLAQIEIEKIAYNAIELYEDGKLAVIVLTADDIAKANAADSDIDGVYQIPRQIAGVEVSAVIRQKGDKVKVSLRSNEYFNVAELAASFGGGGHFHAAGCAFYEDIQAVKKRIIDSLHGKL